ncbi:MAG: substrate-binding domain-containing protein [Desulfurobacteriaceae bacterium]
MGKVIKTFLILTLLALNSSYGGEKTPLIVFHAGSLSVPFKKLEEEFEKEHPNIDVRRESSGSLKAIRKVVDLHKPCDVVASADYSLKRKEVKWGFSNPNLDPCGYRTLIMIALASDYYKKPIYEELLKPNTNVKVEREPNGYKILVPKNFRKVGDKLFIRSKAVALLGLLESGSVDYVVEYKSVALQHRLKYVELPKEINLSDFSLREYYSKVKLVLGNGRVITGKPIAYGITTLKNAPHPKEAKMWEDFVTSERGAEIIRSCYQKALYPPRRISKEKNEKP